MRCIKAAMTCEKVPRDGVLADERRWQRSRELLASCMHFTLSGAILMFVFPPWCRVLPAHKVRSLLWLFRFSGSEGCCAIPFVFLVGPPSLPCAQSLGKLWAPLTSHLLQEVASACTAETAKSGKLPASEHCMQSWHVSMHVPSMSNKHF